MDLRKIKKLIELVEESGISEIEVKSGDEAVRIARPVSSAQMAAQPVAQVALSSQSADTMAIAHPVDSVNAGPVKVISAPISGTFYRAPSPGEKAFVSPGEKVTAGDTLCVIESMKMMNQIEAETTGEVVAVLVQNGDPVETGQALFQIR